MKCKFGSIVTDAAGKIGGHIFQHSRSGIILTSNPVRNTNATKNQSQQRSNFAKVSAAWRNLTVKQKSSWSLYASDIYQTNKLGDKYSMSGYSLFSKCNNNLLYINEKIITNYSLSDNSDSILSFTFSFNTRVPEMLLNIKTTLSENSVLILEASRPVGVGTMSPPTNFNFFKIITESSVVDADVFNDYQSVFGEIASNQTKIFMRLRILNKINGMVTTSLLANHMQELPYWRDYGINWLDLGQQSAGQEFLSMCYLENGICLAGTSDTGHILRSTDYGLTWSDLGQQYSSEYIWSLSYLENGIVLAGTGINGKILRSTDYGLTWTDLGQQYSQNGIMSFVYLINGICLAGTSSDGYILRSTDYGLTWSNLGTISSGNKITSLTYIGVGRVTATTSYPATIIFSDDYGITWNQVKYIASGENMNCSSYLRNNIVLAGSGYLGKIFRSTDSGYTWTDLGQVSEASSIKSILYIINGICLAFSNTTGLILRSTDDGLTWNSIPSEGLDHIFSCSANVENGICLAGSGNSSNIYRSMPLYY